MTLIRTFELAQDISPIYVTTDICNSFWRHKNTHTHISSKWIKYARVHDNCKKI